MKRIGVVIPSITDNLQTELLDGIFTAASASNCDVIVLTTATNVLDFHMQNEIMEGEESIYSLLGTAELDGASGKKLQTACLDTRTFAVVFPLKDKQTPEQCAEEMMIQLDVLIRKMQEGTAVAFLPEPYHVCGYINSPIENCINDLWEQLSNTQPKEHGFSGISQLRRLRREIRKAPELNWNLGELAKRLNISKSYVQKLYKEHFGISYIDDLIEARTAMAKQLLKTTDLRINEVALSCGYQNTTHFMRQFKGKTGMSPSEFRKRD